MKKRSSTRQYEQGARAQAAEATGRRIVEAFVARLLSQWYDEITLDRVAEDAGVTVQTVVRRFGGKEGLLTHAVVVLSAQINEQRATPDDVGSAVDNLFQDYERTGDALVRLLALEPRHPSIQGMLDIGRGEHRRWVSTAFAALLTPLEPVAREQALDALVVATDVYTWKLLRRDMARSVDAAATTMKRMIQAMWLEFSVPR